MVRVIAFVQVVLLLGLLAYLLLLALENPSLLRLPLPFGNGEWLLPSGWAVALAALMGAAYTALLLLPLVWQEKWLRRRDRRERKQLQTQLTDTLQARMGHYAAEQVPLPKPEAAPEPGSQA